MKKILKIARYDFKRLMLNPITLISLIIILIGCFVLGLVYKIPTTPAYSVLTAGQTTQEIFLNFNNNSSVDNKQEIDKILENAQEIISIQQDSICFEYNELENVVEKFNIISTNLEKYATYNSCIYTEENSIDSIKSACKELSDFVTAYKSIPEFHSRLMFKTEEFENLEIISEYFTETTSKNATIPHILDELYAKKAYFSQLNSIKANSLTWKVAQNQIEEFKISYTEKAKEKMNKIFAEMQKINSQVNEYDMQKSADMKNLIKNYKFTAENAENAVKSEIQLLLATHPNKDFYNYQKIKTEDVKISLAKTKFFLNDENLYFTQYQEGLNFNTASSKVSAFDYSYFLMSIIGFMTIIFGIFVAYKLFGLDRKNGKMDLVLSQNVSFNQVFTGKFLALTFSTSFVIVLFAILSLASGAILYGFLPNSMLCVFNLNTAYLIHPLLFWLIKIVGLELQVLFFSILTILLMNLSRKFDLMFAISLAIFVITFICNIFLNNAFWYCLFPFIHADITPLLGGATLESGFLKSAVYASGNFFISLAYFWVVVLLCYNFTRHLFKKN